MKRFVLAEKTSVRCSAAAILAAMVASATIAYSCSWIPQDEVPEADTATIRFKFVQTKGGNTPEIDTNNFILSVVNSSTGEPAYSGAYGSRPEALTVTAGTYDVKVISEEFSAPAFDSPQYGDSSVVIATGGETMQVGFLCRQTNCGIKLTFSETFLKKYGDGKLFLSQEGGSVEYKYDETRTAYVLPGTVNFVYDNGTNSNILFSRSVDGGQLRKMALDATSDESVSDFSIEVDPSVTDIDESITIGQSGDGLSKATAMNVENILSGGFKGDTLWVYGFVVGVITDEKAIDFDCRANTIDGNIVIASSANENSVEKCLGVYLSKAALKTELGLTTDAKRSRLLGHRIFVKGKVDVYKGIPTIKNICDYQVE